MRSIAGPVYNHPLALCDTSTLRPEEGLDRTVENPCAYFCPGLISGMPQDSSFRSNVQRG